MCLNLVPLSFFLQETQKWIWNSQAYLVVALSTCSVYTILDDTWQGHCKPRLPTYSRLCYHERCCPTLGPCHSRLAPTLFPPPCMLAGRHLPHATPQLQHQYSCPPASSASQSWPQHACPSCRACCSPQHSHASPARPPTAQTSSFSGAAAGAAQPRRWASSLALTFSTLRVRAWDLGPMMPPPQDTRGPSL